MKKFIFNPNEIMKRYPLQTQMVSTGLLMAGGDVIAQANLEGKGLANVNWNRTRVYGLFGCFVAAPIISRWYIFMERTFKKTDPVTTFKKVLTDQLVFAPAFLPVFMTVTGLGQHKPWETIKSDLKANYVDLLIANYKVWPMIQMLNFYFVPLNYRIILVQTVALAWNSYLSFKVK